MKNSSHTKTFCQADCAVISDPSNLFYFTDYENADAKLLFTPSGKYYFTDARYFEEASSVATDTEILPISDLRKFIDEHNFRTVGIDTELTYAQYKDFSDRRIESVDIRPVILEMRSTKTEEEIARIAEAQKITDQAFSEMLDLLQEGMTEKEAARLLKCSLYRLGADSLAFEPIVAFGADTSKPHAHPTDAILKKGTPVLMDFGAKYKGYCSDMTRTVSFGNPTDEFCQCYQWVSEAQEKSLAAARAGMSGEECHRIAVNVFSEHGQERFFTHSLGHSLGVDIHEFPSLSARYLQKIPEKAVTSFEPGLYFPGKFGIRIEDIAIFEKTGVRNLTNSEKMLIIL